MWFDVYQPTSSFQETPSCTKLIPLTIGFISRTIDFMVLLNQDRFYDSITPKHPRKKHMSRKYKDLIGRVEEHL